MHFESNLIVMLLALYVGSVQSYSIGQQKLSKIEKCPYQVMLIGKLMWRKRILCGGTLLNNQWILTAGHCASGVTHFDVHLGAKSFRDYDEVGRIIVRAMKFLVHDHFNPNYAANDIALVKLAKPIDFTDRIHPAVLPLAYRFDDLQSARVIAPGWGSLDEDIFTESLQFTDLQVVSNAECAKSYDDTIIRDNILCAKGVYLETVCSGDSGGPLVLKGTNIVVGVTSFGPANGCKISIPGGFTRVTHYIDWIASKIGKLHGLANYDENIV